MSTSLEPSSSLLNIIISRLSPSLVLAEPNKGHRPSPQLQARATRACYLSLYFILSDNTLLVRFAALPLKHGVLELCSYGYEQ